MRGLCSPRSKTGGPFFVFRRYRVGDGGAEEAELVVVLSPRVELLFPALPSTTDASASASRGLSTLFTLISDELAVELAKGMVEKASGGEGAVEHGKAGIFGR